MVGALIRAAAGRAAAAFYRIERRGPAVPPGPVLLVANHPNSLLDPLVLFHTAGRPSRPLARAPLFDRPVIGRLIRAVGGIPVHRREDAPAMMARNRDALQATIRALRAGDAVQIFAEGRSHSDPSVSRLRTGSARIALGAESD
jgi:glycerol-3-phosphate O-acyltransferase / dihydroxyacetone phosphate acyltransferase